MGAIHDSTTRVFSVEGYIVFLFPRVKKKEGGEGSLTNHWPINPHESRREEKEREGESQKWTRTRKSASEQTKKVKKK